MYPSNFLAQPRDEGGLCVCGPQERVERQNDKVIPERRVQEGPQTHSRLV